MASLFTPLISPHGGCVTSRTTYVTLTPQPPTPIVTPPSRHHFNLFAIPSPPVSTSSINHRNPVPFNPFTASATPYHSLISLPAQSRHHSASPPSPPLISPLHYTQEMSHRSYFHPPIPVRLTVLRLIVKVLVSTLLARLI